MGYKPKFLLTAYEQGVDSTTPGDFSTPAHMVLNCSLYCHKLLRVQTNLIKVYKQSFGEDPTSPYTQVYLSPSLNETENILKMTTKLVETKKEEATKLFLLSESQLKKLLTNQNKINSEEEKHTTSVIENEDNDERKRKKIKGPNDSWSILLKEMLPQMISIPATTRQKAIKFGEFLKQQNVLLTENNLLLYKYDGETIQGSSAIDTILFFVTTNEANFARPRDLFLFCQFLISVKAPSHLFDSTKRPLELLKNLKKFYTIK